MHAVDQIKTIAVRTLPPGERKEASLRRDGRVTAKSVDLELYVHGALWRCGGDSAHMR